MKDSREELELLTGKEIDCGESIPTVDTINFLVICLCSSAVVVFSILFPVSLLILLLEFAFYVRDNHPNYFVGKVWFPEFNPAIFPSGDPILPLFEEDCYKGEVIYNSSGDVLFIRDENGWEYEKHKRCKVSRKFDSAYEQFHSKRMVLESWKKIADHLDIFWYPTAGTLLELYRRHTIFYDTDLDLMVDEKDSHKLHKIDQKLLDELQIYPNVFIQILPEKYDNLRGFKRKRYECKGLQTHVYADGDMCSHTWNTIAKMFIRLRGGNRNNSPCSISVKSKWDKHSRWCLSVDLFTTDFDECFTSGYMKYTGKANFREVTYLGMPLFVPKDTRKYLAFMFGSNDLSPDKVCSSSGEWVKKDLPS